MLDALVDSSAWLDSDNLHLQRYCLTGAFPYALITTNQSYRNPIMKCSIADLYLYLIQDYGYICRYNREVKKRGRLPASASVKFHSESQRSVAQRAGSREDGLASQSSPPSASPSAHSAAADRQIPSMASRSDQSGVSPVGNGTHMDQDQRATNAVNANSHGSRPPEKRRRISTSMSVPSLIQSGLQRHTHPDSHTFRPRAGSSSVAFVDNHIADSEALISDESAGYPSPANGGPYEYRKSRNHRGSFRSAASNDGIRESFSTAATVPDGPSPDLLQKAPTEDCCYRFLDPVLPYIRNILPASVACELLDIFLTDPGSSLFRGASPYILTRIFRKKSILHPTNPRYTTPALLATILWCVAQTADVMLLHVPGTRAKVVNDLYDLATSLTSERDPDRWRRIHGM